VHCAADTGLDDAGRYLPHLTPDGGDCPANGWPVAAALEYRGRFQCASNPESIAMDTIDRGDRVRLSTTLRLPTSDVIGARLDIDIRGYDVRRLIAELTAIADRRGL
jgi:hypothetical protein